MSCDLAPTYLGAYVLGALDPAERRDAEAHLARCADCTAELEGFRGVTAQLDRFPVQQPVAEPVTASPELFGRVAAAVRRPARRRWLPAVAAAAVLVAGAAGWAAVQQDAEVHSASAAGVRMSVAAEEGASGSVLDVTVAGLPAGVDCQLFVRDDEGEWHGAGDWTTYGGEVAYRLWTEVPPQDVAAVVLRERGGEELVRVRVGD